MAHVLENRTLEHFRDAVSETYGDRLERIVLFGSRARGDERSDSDYDVAVFLRDLGDLADPRELAARDAEMKRLADGIYRTFKSRHRAAGFSNRGITLSDD